MSSSISGDNLSATTCFDYGKKMFGEKYVVRKAVFMFLPSHVFAQIRSLQTPVTYRTMTTARFTFLSSDAPFVRIRIIDLRTSKFIGCERVTQRKSERTIEHFDAIFSIPYSQPVRCLQAPYRWSVVIAGMIPDVPQNIQKSQHVQAIPEKALPLPGA